MAQYVEGRDECDPDCDPNSDAQVADRAEQPQPHNLVGSAFAISVARSAAAGDRAPNWETWDRICKLHGLFPGQRVT